MQRVTQYQGTFKARHRNSRSSRNAEPRARTVASPRELSPQSPQKDCTQRPGHNRSWRDRVVPGWQAEPVRATGNRYPEGGTFAGKKRKPLLRALAPPHFQGLSDSLSPFLGRGYGAYRPQQTHTKVGLELAGDTQGDKLAKPSPERDRTPRPLRLGAGVRGRAGKAALPASPQHFYGGGD